MNDLFFYEKQVIQNALSVSEKDDYRYDPLLREYVKLLADYQKLLRQTDKLLKISDHQQNLLNKAKNALQIEMSERKKAYSELQNLTEKLREANRKLANLSTLDGLTSIPNRRKFDKVLKKEWNRCKRNQDFISAIFADIDFFKQYNDTYGHLAGDDCIKAIAGIISKCLHRPGDFAARYGGEEFVVLLPETDRCGASIVAENIRFLVEQRKIRHKASSVSPVVTLSLGVATIKAGAFDTPEKLLYYADTALYQAKQTGRNKLAVLDTSE